MMEGVVPSEINKKTVEFCESQPENSQPIALLKEDWFETNVIKNVQVSGVVRSLLGSDFGLPNMIANHRSVCPKPAQEWHTDGGSKYGPELDYLQVFYYPQDCTLDLGPTELLPGSHFLFAPQMAMAHYGNIKGSYKAIAPAGSIFITIYSIWHRRSISLKTGIRNNLKYNYWRCSPPQGDWIKNPEFDINTADFSLGNSWDPECPTFRDQFQDSFDTAEMYSWLRGKSKQFRLKGGQGWPLPPHKWIEAPFGVPDGL